MAPLLLVLVAPIGACGARTGVIGAQGGEATGGGTTSGGTVTATCSGDMATLAASITLDPGTSIHEPESPPHLVWKGPELFVVNSRWDDGTYNFAMASVATAGGTLVPGVTSSIGDIDNAFDLRAAWDGNVLALVWSDPASGVVLERRALDGTALGARTTIVPATAQVVPVALVSDSTQYTLAWAAQSEMNTDFHIMVGGFSPSGATVVPPATLAQGAALDIGTTLVRAQGQLFADWSAQEGDGFAYLVSALGPDDVPLSPTPVQTGSAYAKSNLVFDGKELSIAMFDYRVQKAVIWSRTPAPGVFHQRATLDATDAVTLVTDACGHLGALIPTGMYSMDNPISTGLSFRLVGADGALGTEIVLPVSQDYVEGWDLVAVDGGFVAAWVQGSQVSASPSRTLMLAAITLR